VLLPLIGIHGVYSQVQPNARCNLRLITPATRMELFDTDTDYSTLILGAFPLDQIAHVGVSPSISLKLFGRKIIFEVFQPMRSR